ncbi:hypothetical protein GOP47_0018724 [Adiantum capillus-veneris]|uniref:Uncharacterized protein n=1 Tax=Adiantum capillus-veneris TaxID=13818 RepID=A0A9D4Z9W8_ADICA|nr:hypothetical protein GOP47_0018724 [Adiantum capillus-veneris]
MGLLLLRDRGHDHLLAQGFFPQHAIAKLTGNTSQRKIHREHAYAEDFLCFYTDAGDHTRKSKRVGRHTSLFRQGHQRAS